MLRMPEREEMAGSAAGVAPEPPWRSAPRRRSVPRPQLSREVVVEAALRVLESDGGDALTMRRVAEEIGVSASSLYGYVANKEELVQLVLDRIEQGGNDGLDDFADLRRAGRLFARQRVVGRERI